MRLRGKLGQWLQEQAVLFERTCRNRTTALEAPNPIILAVCIDLRLREVAPQRLSKSSIRWDRQGVFHILPALGHYPLTQLRREHFCAELRQSINQAQKATLQVYR